MKKKIVSIVLVMTMVLCLIPAMAFANDAGASAGANGFKGRDIIGDKIPIFVDFPGGPVKKLQKVKVSFTSQKSGEFLHAPQFNYEVASNLAESYGYSDSVNGVSVLDVLVAAHKLVYGADFTRNTANNYLTVGDNGVTMQFGSTAYPVFFMNRARSTDGTQSSSGIYNPTNVMTQQVYEGNLIEFFFLEDADYADMYNWFTDADGNYSRTFTATAGEPFELGVSGFHVINAGSVINEEEMVNAGSSVYRAQVYTVDIATGALTKMAGSITGSNGKAMLYFEEPGEYWIAAYGGAGCTFKQILTLTKVNVEEKVIPKVSVDFTSQSLGAFLHAPKFGYEVAGDLAESYGYNDTAEGVSVLDVLVAAHELVYGEGFTKASAKDYLEVSGSGRVTKQFGRSWFTYFFLNRGYAPAGLNAFQEVKDGDLVEFFYQEDNGPGDTYNWFVDASGTYSRNFTVNAGEAFDMYVRGYNVYAGFESATEETMVGNGSAQGGVQICTVDPETGALTEISGAVTNGNGRVLMGFEEPGEYLITEYSTRGVMFTQVLTVTRFTVVDPAVTSVFVDITSQMQGEFIHAPQFGYEVASDLAESYGFTDEVDGVSVLDVLTAAHELAFGADFTKETAGDYLSIVNGSLLMQFGYAAYPQFYLNHAMANNGMQSNGLYNATTVLTQEVKDGDLVEFFFLDGADYGNMYNWFLDADGEYGREFEAHAGEAFTLTLKGAAARYGFYYEDEEDMVASTGSGIQRVQIYTVDPSTGALTKVEGAVTDSAGRVTLCFEGPGEYWITGYGGLNKTVLTLTKIVVSDHEWGLWRITKMPTRTRKGEMSRTCSICGKTETREMPELVFVPAGIAGGSTLVPKQR